MTNSNPTPRLSEGERQELLNLRMHFIDSEQLLQIRSWQAVNPNLTPLDREIAAWRMAAMDKWSAEHPLMSLLLFPVEGGQS